LGPFLLLWSVTTWLYIYDLWNRVLFFPRLLSIAEETLAEFLSKATGTAVEWVQMPGMKVSLKFFSLFDQLVILFSIYFIPIERNREVKRL